MFITNIIKEFKAPYGGYPVSAVIVMGWFVAIGMLAAGIYFSRKPWKDEFESKISKEVK
jgi:NSS family neurotransmitter:Na+ symporter